VPLLAFLLVLDFLVLPQVAGTERALRLLDGVAPWLLALAVALEAASLLSYSRLTRCLVQAPGTTLWWTLRADLTGLGAGHLLPGAGAATNALRYRLLVRGGAHGADAGVGIAVQAVLSTTVLAGLLWVSLVVSIPFAGPYPAYVTAALVGALALAVTAAVLLARPETEDTEAAVSRWVVRRLPARWRPRASRLARDGGAQLQRLVDDREGLRTSTAWAVGSWAFDAASLWVCLAAFGRRVDPVTLLVAYALANLVATLPVSPGGLGLVEGLLIPSLVGFGTPHAVAVLGVVTWRLLEFWAPIPLSGLAYLSLRLSVRLRGTSWY
jgi:uncharacterized protein (TIRG00374 family)